jgi:UDP-N-acetylmuramate dehydrogenase
MAITILDIQSPITQSSLLTPSVPLADKNWFKTGGLAQWYGEPTTAEEFQKLLAAAHTYELPLFVLGEGANILISDEGYQGLVIRPRLTSIRRLPGDATHDIVEAGAGVSFGNLIAWCLEQNLLGLEEFSGIPGTVGGSVFINIHYFEFLLSQFIESALVIHKTTGELTAVNNDWFHFGYDYSTLHSENYYLVSARFKLRKVSTHEALIAKGRSFEIARHRAKRYPTSHTCGSFFRNFHAEEVAQVTQGKQLIFVAYYLDKLGVKGELSVGGATVSHQHANMIVNKGTATSTDIITLARTMQELVFNNYGIMPQPECRLIGFSTYPLHHVQ